MPDMLLLAASAVQAPTPAGIRLYDGLGKVHFPISTSSPEAQRYFDQGLGFAYGFNHAAAIASFREAQRLDPGCAMCWWGEALAHGPNINAPLTPDANALALKAIAKAQELSAKVTPAERALIMALAKRYSPDPNAVRAELDGAYADAMLTVARYYPAHDDISLLAAEAAMDTLPWDYWEADRQTSKPRLAEAIRLVEAVTARNAAHPQAPHLYIHLMENGPDPKRAEAAADRLAAPLAGDAGHLVHMPAHIYYRLGRWKDSIRANIAAARKDEDYIKESDDKGFVRYGYYPHNVHFIVTSAQMGGDLPTAIREARAAGGIVDAETATQIAWIQAIHAAPYFATLQFAPAADVLAMAEPDPRLAYVQGARHYARAVAYAQQHNQRGFDAEMAALSRVRQSAALKPMARPGHARARPAGHGRACRAREARLHPRTPSAGGGPLPSGARDRGPHLLHGAALVVFPGQPVARRRAVPRRAISGGAAGLHRGARQIPQQWLGALRPRRVGAGARPAGPCRGGAGRAQPRLDGRSEVAEDGKDLAPPQALAAMNFSTTGAIFSRHLRPLKMP